MIACATLTDMLVVAIMGLTVGWFVTKVELDARVIQRRRGEGDGRQQLLEAITDTPIKGEMKVKCPSCGEDVVVRPESDAA